MRNILLFVSFILAASPVVAQSTISFEPPDPTSTTPLTLIVTESDSCPPPPVVTRSGSTITVALGVGPCLSPPIEITHRLEIGTLPAGTYSVIVTDGGAQVVTATLTGAAAVPGTTPSCSTFRHASSLPPSRKAASSLLPS